MRQDPIVCVRAVKDTGQTALSMLVSGPGDADQAQHTGVVLFLPGLSGALLAERDVVIMD